jgi:hypothetical protein
VQPEHACFETKDTGCSLKALNEAACQFIYINGCKVKDCNPVPLCANDRIIFGTSACFLFRHQDMVAKASMPDTPECPITYELVMEERAKKDAASMPTLKVEAPVT